jgi:intraflagellar transport protein 81
MSTPNELKFIVETLVNPPFSKTWTVIQLHEELPSITLLQVLCDILAFIDDADPTSCFRKVDARKDVSEEYFGRVGDFLRMLKMKEALVDGGYTFHQEMVASKRETLIITIFFLLNDLVTHKKRAYLGIYLSLPGRNFVFIIDIPSDFIHDETIVELTSQIQILQEEFKTTHKYFDGLKESSSNSGTLKREIQQMEEEKQQVLSKISRLKKKVESFLMLTGRCR